MTLRELAERLECRLEGDGTLEVHRVAGIESAAPGDLTFLANARYAKYLAATRATAIILGEKDPAAACAMLRTPEPYLAFAHAVALFAVPVRPAPGVDPRAAVAADAELGEGVSIGAFVVIGSGARIGSRTVVHPHAHVAEGARVGSECVLHSHAVVREGVTLGDRVVLQDGAVIGGDGYGFARRADGSYEKIPQPSGVVIEDDVEIGANTTIDRPAVGETRIGAGTKIDNLVQVAHGVSVGRNTMLAAQVGIAGSTVIGDSVMLGGQVGVNGHVEIGSGAVAVGQSGITRSVSPGAIVGGYPAMDATAWRKASALVRRLPELKRQIDELERRLSELEARGKDELERGGRRRS